MNAQLVGNGTNTLEGSVVTLQCVEGYVPSAVTMATCTRKHGWLPPPDQHNCTIEEGITYFKFSDLISKLFDKKKLTPMLYRTKRLNFLALLHWRPIVFRVYYRTFI